MYTTSPKGERQAIDVAPAPNTPQTGVAAADTACPLTLSALRRQLLALIVGSPLFSDAEQLRANHSAHECACPLRLARWVKNTRRVAAEREQADLLAGFAQGLARFEAKLTDKPTAAQLADLHALAQHPAALPAERAQVLLRLPAYTRAQAGEAAAKLRARLAERTGQPIAVQVVAPTTPAPAEQPTAPVAYATEVQCAEVARLAAWLTPREQRDALRHLPRLTEPEAAAFIRGLHLRRGCRLRYPVTLRGQLVQVPVAERHYEGAKVDYVQELGTGRVLPRQQADVLSAGPLVRRVWAN